MKPFYTLLLFTLIAYLPIKTYSQVVPDSIKQQLSIEDAVKLKAERDNEVKTPQLNIADSKINATTPTAHRIAKTKKTGRLTDYVAFDLGYGFPKTSGINNSNRYRQYMASVAYIHQFNDNWDLGAGLHYMHVKGHTHKDMEKVDVHRNFMGIHIPGRWFPIGKIVYLEARPEITWQRVKNYDYNADDDESSKYELDKIEFGCPLGIGFEIPVSPTVFFLVGGHYNPIKGSNSGYTNVPLSLSFSVGINIE